jgi:NAD(P)-dependent dehydrogenase (short-subunit alcohol dehydrogenase family)
MTTVLVTGSNSGIGRATAVYLAARGFDVFASMRNLDSAGKLLAMAKDAGAEVHPVQLDVSNDDSVRDAVAGIEAQTSGIDVLVNNAGIGGNATVEESPADLLLNVFDVNVCGGVRCLQAVLPGMRARRSGAIINVTSVVGRLAHVGQAPYVASKWAMEGLCEELAHEVAGFGIRVAIIEPGVTKSAIFAKNVDAPNSTGAYDDQYRRMFQFYASGIPQATPAEEVAAVIHHAITTDEPQLRYACSWGGESIVRGRQAMTDEEWVSLGAWGGESIVRGRQAMTDEEWVSLGATVDADYYAGFERHFGVNIAP